jgi:iron complex outermembrane receptor protein
MKKLYLLNLLLIFSLNLLAQNVVKGKVTDAQTYTPVAGASITIKGEKKGAISDANGNFTLNVSSPSQIIIVSSIGYAEKEVTATTGILNIELTQTSNCSW